MAGLGPATHDFEAAKLSARSSRRHRIVRYFLLFCRVRARSNKPGFCSVPPASRGWPSQARPRRWGEDIPAGRPRVRFSVTLPPLRDVIARHGLAARHSLGQHFLLDGNLTDRIVREAGDLTGRHVIEVGPG